MACKDRAYSWSEQASESLAVTIYADHLKAEISVTSDRERSVVATAFVLPPGLKDSALAHVFPGPVVPRAGEGSEKRKKRAAPGEKPPVLPGSTTGTSRPFSSHAVEHILKEAEAKGISGGLRLENPRFEAGKAYVEIHAWAKIEIFGQRVAFDERLSHGVDPSRRRTVWNNGWAHIEVCFHPPKQICATLYISKWGFERHWNDCVDLPGPASTASPG
jgi:hypothetical protein